MLAISFMACNKSDTGITNDQILNLKKRGTIAEEYVYHGVHYVLNFMMTILLVLQTILQLRIL